VVIHFVDVVLRISKFDVSPDRPAQESEGVGCNRNGRGCVLVGNILAIFLECEYLRPVHGELLKLGLVLRKNSVRR